MLPSFCRLWCVIRMPRLLWPICKVCSFLYQQRFPESQVFVVHAFGGRDCKRNENYSGSHTLQWHFNKAVNLTKCTILCLCFENRWFQLVICRCFLEKIAAYNSLNDSWRNSWTLQMEIYWCVTLIGGLKVTRYGCEPFFQTLTGRCNIRRWISLVDTGRVCALWMVSLWKHLKVLKPVYYCLVDCLVDYLADGDLSQQTDWNMYLSYRWGDLVAGILIAEFEGFQVKTSMKQLI